MKSHHCRPEDNNPQLMRIHRACLPTLQNLMKHKLWD